VKYEVIIGFLKIPCHFPYSQGIGGLGDGTTSFITIDSMVPLGGLTEGVIRRLPGEWRIYASLIRPTVLRTQWREAVMHKIVIGLAFAAMMAMPASAQDYRKNWVECARELGLTPDPTYTHRVQPEAGGHVLRRWHLHSEAQQAMLDACVTRKASLAAAPPTKKTQPASR
jgi:hypothetical protein